VEGGVEVKIAELITILCDVCDGKAAEIRKLNISFWRGRELMESYKIERTTRVRCRLLYNALEHEKLRDK